MRRILFALVIGLGGAAILISLGVWQVQRLAEKQGKLAQIDATIVADPIPLLDALEPEFQRYAPVALTGQFGAGHLRILASRKQIGPVYRIVRPFDAEGYGRILVDTGWLREAVTVPEVPQTPLELAGNLDAPNEIDSYTPGPDLTANVWFARDVPAMATALSTEPVLVVLRDAARVDLGVTPWPVDSAGIPNDHLQYAITWFSLALIWVGMSFYFLRRKRSSEMENPRP